MTRFPVFGHHFPVLEYRFLLCPVLSHVPSRILAVPARSVPNFGCPGPSRSLARILACPVVPLSRDNEGTSVPLSRKVALSRPVGNATTKCNTNIYLISIYDILSLLIVNTYDFHNFQFSGRKRERPMIPFRTLVLGKL